MLWCDYERLCYRSIIEDQYKWTHTREIVAMLYNVNRGSKNSAKSGKQLIPLSIDGIGQPKKEPLTIEEYNEAVKRINKFFKK